MGHNTIYMYMYAQLKEHVVSAWLKNGNGNSHNSCIYSIRVRGVADY